MSSQIATQHFPTTSSPGDGPRTITITEAAPNEDSGPSNGQGAPSGTLKLRGSTKKPRRKVEWREDVIDNEDSGRQSSKICCLYHKPKPYYESSDEDDSDHDSDSHCSHDTSHMNTRRPDTGASAVHHLEDDEISNNAYEVNPSSKKGKHKAS